MKKQRSNYPVAKSAKGVLDFIKVFSQVNGYAPSYREIGENFGKTHEWARYVVTHLQKEKKVRVRPGKHRGIELPKKS
ncbi:MAG: hypothetical protein WDZ61_00460 [Parcubacteria group bacterium]